MDMYRTAKMRFVIHSARWTKKRFMGFSINGQIMHLFTIWNPKVFLYRVLAKLKCK